MGVVAVWRRWRAGGRVSEGDTSSGAVCEGVFAMRETSAALPIARVAFATACTRSLAVSKTSALRMNSVLTASLLVGSFE